MRCALGFAGKRLLHDGLVSHAYPVLSGKSLCLVPAQVNAVPRPSDGSVSWVQQALSAFVAMRCAAGKQQLRMMPVLIVASTLASATSLADTASARTAVAEVQLMPSSYQDTKAIFLDVCRRVGQPVSSDDLSAHVKLVLKMVAGCPRHLAWAMALISGSHQVVTKEVLMLGEFTGTAGSWRSVIVRPSSLVLSSDEAS